MLTVVNVEKLRCIFLAIVAPLPVIINAPEEEKTGKSVDVAILTPLRGHDALSRLLD